LVFARDKKLSVSLCVFRAPLHPAMPALINAGCALPRTALHVAGFLASAITCESVFGVIRPHRLGRHDGGGSAWN
jgi:hypothetical protein